MSDAGIDPKPLSNATPGSKRWFWEMRAMHISLWFMPVMPILYATVNDEWVGWHGVSVATYYVWSPWVLCVVVMAMASRALWRVEINVAGNRHHPFTVRDQKVLRMAMAAAFGVMVYVLVLIEIRHVGGLTREQVRDASSGHDVVMTSMFVLGVLLQSMERMHCKGRHAYEELEKGV